MRAGDFAVGGFAFLLAAGGQLIADGGGGASAVNCCPGLDMSISLVAPIFFCNVLGLSTCITPPAEAEAEASCAPRDALVT